MNQEGMAINMDSVMRQMFSSMVKSEVKIELEKAMQFWGLLGKENQSTKLKYLDVKGAGSFLNKTPQAIRNMVHRKQIPVMKKGTRLYFLESDLVAWLEDGRRATPEELRINCVDALRVRKNN